MAFGVCLVVKIYYAHAPQLFGTCTAVIRSISRCNLEIYFKFYALKETGKSQLSKDIFSTQSRCCDTVI